MTAKELFEKHGSVWWARRSNPDEKSFKPLGFSEDGTKLIGEDSDGYPGWIPASDILNFLHQPPKQKVVRWKWAYKRNEYWVEPDTFHTENEAMRVFAVKTLTRLDYTATTFEE
jgi:hypothetical protein